MTVEITYGDHRLCNRDCDDSTALFPQLTVAGCCDNQTQAAPAAVGDGQWRPSGREASLTAQKHSEVPCGDVRHVEKFVCEPCGALERRVLQRAVVRENTRLATLVTRRWRGRMSSTQGAPKHLATGEALVTGMADAMNDSSLTVERVCEVAVFDLCQAHWTLHLWHHPP